MARIELELSREDAVSLRDGTFLVNLRKYSLRLYIGDQFGGHFT